MAAVCALIMLAFDFSGSVNGRWTLVLMASTLPLSLVSVLGTWSLIHGASLEVFAVFYFGCGVVNVWAISMLLATLRGRQKRRPSDKPLHSAAAGTKRPDSGLPGRGRPRVRGQEQKRMEHGK